MRKKIRWKRATIAAVAAVMVLTVTAVAASRSQVFVHWTDAGYAYASLPEAQKALEAVGGTLTLPESILGYTFQGASTKYQMLAETEDGATFTLQNNTEQRGISVDYESQGAQVTLTAEPAPEAEKTGQPEVEQRVPISGETTVETGELVLEWQAGDQAELYTLPYFYREELEPVTVQEIQRETESSVEETREETVKTLQWCVDGVMYTLRQTAGELTEADLAAMAETLMEQQ